MNRKLISILLSFCVFPMPILNISADNEICETVEILVSYDPNMFHSDLTGDDEAVNPVTDYLTENIESISEANIIDEIEYNSNNIALYFVTTTDEATIAESVSRLRNITFAEPNYHVNLLDIPEQNTQWGLNSTFGVNLLTSSVPAFYPTGEGVRIAVIDTGIDINHPDLRRRIVDGWDFVNNDNTVFDNAIEDTHGTHVAGIIAGDLNDDGYRGVTTQSKIIPVKALTHNGGTVYDIIKGIEYAQSHGAQIANCSFGMEYYSHFLYGAIHNSDMVFVCAAGNNYSNHNTMPYYPASYDLDNIISVGAIDQNGNYAEFSDYGEDVDIAAPGVDIYSTLPNNTYGSLSGTSMAAPFVSGAIALLLDKEDMLPCEIVERICNTSRKLSSLNGKVNSSGLLDISHLVDTTVKPTWLHEGVYGARSVNDGIKNYLVGGYTNNGYSNTIQYFDFYDYQWSGLATLPTPCACSAVAYYDNKIYTVGGESPTGILDGVQIYNLDSALFTIGTAMPQKLSNSAYAVLNDKLYVFGGVNEYGYTNTVFEYDFNNDTWTKKNNLPLKLAYASATTVGNAIYIVGGADINGVKNSIYCYNPIEDNINKVGRLTIPRRDFSLACLDNKLYVFGGSSTYNKNGTNRVTSRGNAIGAYLEASVKAVEVFDTKTRMSTINGSLDNPTIGAAVINHNDAFYAMGGFDGALEPYSSRYVIASVPKNIRFKTNGNMLKTIWTNISGATSYVVEFDGNEYTTKTNSFEIHASDSVEHRIRVKSLCNGNYSDWSDYKYYYLNSLITDAKSIENNTSTNDKLYATGQVKWYKVNNNQSGVFNITLSNIPLGCTYLLQLCDATGSVISTGEDNAGVIEIKNLIASPYAYYVKVSSLYGGSDTDDYPLNDSSDYTLTCSIFASTDDTTVDRVKCAFLNPSSFDDSVETSYMDIDSYEFDDDQSPSVFEYSEILSVEPGAMGSNCGTEEYVPDDYDTDESNVNAPMLLSNDSSLVSDFSVSDSLELGISKNHGINVPASSSSQTTIKLVVELVSQDLDDEFTLSWFGSTTNKSNFWYHYDNDGTRNNYYLTANLGYSSSSRFYYFTVTRLNNSSTGSGSYQANVYIYEKSNTLEDYNNIICGNETPLNAQSVNPIGNSYTQDGTIDHPMDKDFYYINLSGSEKATAYLVSPYNKKYEVSFLDNDCTSNDVSSSEFMDGWIEENKSYASITGSGSNRKYCIEVDSNDGSFSPDEEYTLFIYKYSINDIGDFELNNTFSKANNSSKKNSVLSRIGNSETLATSINFKIDSPVDRDIYAVDMNANEKLSIYMTLPENYNDNYYQYRFEVYSDMVEYDGGVSYTSRSYNNSGSQYSKFVTFIPNKSGTYYFAVKSLTGQFSLDIEASLLVTKTSLLDNYELVDQENDFEASNDFIYTAIIKIGDVSLGAVGCKPISGTINATLDNELDIDWYRYNNGAATKTATIDVSGISLDNIEMLVLDSDYKPLSNGGIDNDYVFVANETYYIGIYVKDSRYGNIISSNNSYNLSISLTELRSDLVFSPVGGGTFIYDNDPEFLTEDDLADENLGDTLLMSADGLSGIVDFQTSHSIQSYMIDDNGISLDLCLYNPTTENVIVQFERLGYQAPYEVDPSGTNWTASNWASLQAWADFLQFDIVDNILIGDTKCHYHNYMYKNSVEHLSNQGIFVIEPNTTQWILGDGVFKITQKCWSPFNLVTRFRVINGTVNLGFAAYKNKNKVIAPKASKLVYDITTQRSYPTGYNICNHECDCYNIGIECEHICVKEHDVNGKPKGVANSVAEVESRCNWLIDENSEYYTPTVYNYSNKNGFTISGIDDYFWITNFNPSADIYGGTNNGMESDIIPLEFKEINDDDTLLNTWYFDTRHTNPLSGNILFSGLAPISDAMSLGNYGVVEQYNISIINTTNEVKRISYKMQTSSHAIITYKIDDNNWSRRIKLGELIGEDEDPSEFLERIFKEIFQLSIAPHKTLELKIEVILPNADNGGFKHQLKINK